jgi:magnesium transporter
MRTFYRNDAGFFPCKQQDAHCWVNIENPDLGDKDYLFNELGVPEAFFNDIEDIDERPRLEMENGWCLIILRIPVKDFDNNLPFGTVPLGIIFKDKTFVSICFTATEMIQDFIRYSQRKTIAKRNNFDLVLRLLVTSSVWFLKYLKQINQQIKLAEKQLAKSIKNEDLQGLLQIEKCLVFFTTSLKGNDILIPKIKNLKDFKDSYDPELLEDVEIELRQAQEMTHIYSDILNGMMDAYASVISNNLNSIMKLLTSISIILMIPTLVASLYGMNVPNSLEKSQFGFWIVLLISLLCALLGIVYFKRKRWF